MMPLSKATEYALSLEREKTWMRLSERGCIFWSLEKAQWFFRDREQNKRNEERKIQWATKLRFIRPDIKKSLAEELNEMLRKAFIPQFSYTIW